MCEYVYDEYDDYTEPHQPELSGPVTPSRRGVTPRTVAHRRAIVRALHLNHLPFATPFRTGPPAL
jgi:hypothetical protein